MLDLFGNLKNVSLIRHMQSLGKRNGHEIVYGDIACSNGTILNFKL